MANNLTTEKKVTAVGMLAEGNSIRAIERMTGVHRDTIMRLGVRVGEACAKIQDEKMRGLNCKHVEVDEIWGFVGSKKKNAVPHTTDYALLTQPALQYMEVDPRRLGLLPHTERYEYFGDVECFVGELGVAASQEG